ncbi:MAG: HepT-like ribonuclease domain-containing protein [Mesorhizobium sp.]
MPSEKALGIVETIARNIVLARDFVRGLTFEQFAADERTIYAVTRCLEIISEASRRLSAQTKARHPHTPWDRIAGAGNVYRHDYEDVLPIILWNTVADQLGPLQTAISAELKELKGK